MHFLLWHLSVVVVVNMFRGPADPVNLTQPEPLHLRFIDLPNRRSVPRNEAVSVQDRTMAASMRMWGATESRGVSEIVENPKLARPGHAFPANPLGIRAYMWRETNPNVYASKGDHKWYKPGWDTVFEPVDHRHYDLPYQQAKGYLNH